MKKLMISAVCALGSSVALAALPPPTPQQAEAAKLASAKTAYAGAVGNFQQRLHGQSSLLRGWLLLLVVELAEEEQQGLQNFRVRKQR